jgi:glycosyltransferase involved in cell wall biosynthesis
MGYFPEQAGGLNRYFHDLAAQLTRCGVSGRALVAGSADVAAHSRGRMRAFAPLASALPRRMLAAREAVAAAMRDDPPQLVVSHFALYTFPALGAIGDRPLVVHFQGPWADEARAEGAAWASRAARRAIERAVYGRATAFVVLSRAFARVLHERYGVAEERIRVVPGGVDVARFAASSAPSRRAARETLGWPTDRPIALAVRRLARRMGLEDLIDAARDVRRRVPDALVLIAGGGRLRAELDARVRDAGLQDHVRLLGFLPDDQLPLAYRAADVTVVPTVALEGFGLIVAESLAAGTPAIVTPVGGLPEVVEGLSPSLVTDAPGARAIVERLSAALDGTLRLPDAKACERFARERYAWDVVAERVAEVYREAAGCGVWGVVNGARHADARVREVA